MKPLATGLGRAGGALKAFGGKLKAFGSAVLSAAGPLIAFVGVAKTIHSVANAFGEMDKIAKDSRALGLTTEELVGLEHAAGLSGVSSEQLRGGLQRAAREGVNIAELADQMEKLPGGVERAQLAFAVLGRRGQDLIPLLMQGGDAIRSMAAEGADLAGFSALDGAKIEEANDSLARAKLAFTGIFRTIAVEIAPHLNGLGQKIKAFGVAAGKVFKFLKPIFTSFQNVAMAAWETISAGATMLWNSIGMSGSITFADIQGRIIDFMATMEFAWKNVPELAAFAWEKTKLGAVTLFEDIKFFFTDQLMPIVEWFSRNWRDIFKTIFDFTATVFINLGKNIRNAMKVIWDFIKSGGRKGLKFTWEPLTEGFKSSVKELPDIPKRALTELEKELTASSDRMGSSLSEGLSEHVAMRRAELLSDVEAPGFEKIEDTKFDFADDAGENLGEKIGSKLGDLEGPAVAQRDTADAFSAIFAAMRGGTSDKLLKNNEQQLTEQKAQTALLKKYAFNSAVELVAGHL